MAKHLDAEDVEFLMGHTHDGCPFVISLVGSLASGVICMHDGTRLRIPTIEVESGVQLKEDLSAYDASEVLAMVQSFSVH